MKFNFENKIKQNENNQYLKLMEKKNPVHIRSIKVVTLHVHFEGLGDLQTCIVSYLACQVKRGGGPTNQ